MALIACSECGARISDKAPMCVKCGCPVSKDAHEPKDTVTCISCGAEVSQIAVVCPNCGEPPVWRVIPGINDCGAGSLAGPPRGARPEAGNISVGAIAASYIVGAIVPVIGWAMAIYLLVKGRIAHAMGVAVLAIFMAYVWIALVVNPSGRSVFPSLRIGFPPPVVTKAEYDRIEEGMTYEDVEETIGTPGEELSRSNIVGYSTAIYGWANPNGSNMNAMFQNGRLVNKAQFGLP